MKELAPLPYRDHILVADKDPHLGQRVATILRRAGFTTVVVTDGIAAITALNQQTAFLCALLDVDMPGPSEINVAWTLAGQMPDLPVILMSGFPRRVVHDHLSGLSVTGILRKPFRIEEMLPMITHALSRVNRTTIGQAAPAALAL